MSAEAELSNVERGETFRGDTFEDNTENPTSNEEAVAVEKADGEGKDQSAEIELIKQSEGWVFPKVKVWLPIETESFCVTSIVLTCVYPCRYLIAARRLGSRE